MWDVASASVNGLEYIATIRVWTWKFRRAVPCRKIRLKI